jgi:hypothetical protein
MPSHNFFSFFYLHVFIFVVRKFHYTSISTVLHTETAVYSPYVCMRFLQLRSSFCYFFLIPMLSIIMFAIILVQHDHQCIVLYNICNHMTCSVVFCAYLRLQTTLHVHCSHDYFFKFFQGMHTMSYFCLIKLSVGLPYALQSSYPFVFGYIYYLYVHNSFGL